MTTVNNGPGSAVWSPAEATDLDTLGLPEFATQAQSPLDYSSDAPIVVVPAPPSPSVGGKPGLSRALGWTTGLLPSRQFRQRFHGETLVVPNQGPGPATGPVGFSNRTGRLAAGVDALTARFLPDPKTIADSFTQPNPLLVHMNDTEEG